MTSGGTGPRRLVYAVGALACALGAVLRLTDLDLVPFGTGEVDPIRTIDDILVGAEFPLHGADIGPGVFGWAKLGPAFFYVLAPFVALARLALDPAVGAMAALVIAGLIALPLIWRIGERHFGTGSGALAALLFAASPYPFFLARHFQNHALVTPAVVLLFLALFELLETRKLRWAVCASAALAAGLQFHVTIVVFVPLFLGALLVARVPPRGWALGLAAGLVVYLPFLYRQVLEGFPDVSGILRAFAADDPAWSGESQWAAVAWIGKTVLFSVEQTPLVDQPRWVVIAGQALLGLTLTSALAGSIVGIARLARPDRRPSALAWPFLLAWIVLPLLFAGMQSSAVFVRHFVAIFPAPQLIAGAGLAMLARPGPLRTLRQLAVLAVALWLTAAQVHTVQRYKQQIEAVGLAGGRLSLHVQEELVSEMHGLGLDERAARRLVLVGGKGDPEGLRYLLLPGHHVDPSQDERLDPNRLVVIAPSEASDVLLERLGELDWEEPWGLMHHAARIDEGQLEVTWNDQVVQPRVRWSQHYLPGEPGPVRIRVPLRREAGDRIFVLIDTNLCLEELRVGPVTRRIDNCADDRFPLWIERFHVELYDELPAGDHEVEIDASNPVGRLELRVTDLTLPLAPS